MKNKTVTSLLVLLLFVSCKKEITNIEEDGCQCTNDLDFVIGYYERNLPGYKDNVTPETEAIYKKLKATLKEEATKVNNPSDCFKIATYYVEFFKDNHSRINMSLPRVDETDDKQLSVFLDSDIFKNRETYKLSSKDS